MKLKDEIIIQAISALQDSGIVNDGKYDKEYKGYISSFGASIIQSGLLPAVIFYESKPEKVKLIYAIVKVLKSKLSNYYGEIEYNNNGIKFSNFIINRKTEKKKIEKDVDEAAVALKLAIRTFKEKKSNSNNYEGTD